MAPDRQKVVQAAEKLAARGRIQAAIDEYRKVLERHPNDTSTLNRVGDLYARLNRMPEAIDLFQKTAESFGRQGFFVKAIAIYKKIIRLDPSQIRAYEALADLYHRQGLSGDALAQYQVVAEYHTKHDDTESAVKIYYSMVEIEPTNPSRRLKLASLLQKSGKTSKALDQFYEIASLMLTHSRDDDALRVLVGALDVDAGNLDFIRKSMAAFQKAGFAGLADDLLEAAIRRNPQANALRLDALEATPAQPGLPPPARKRGASARKAVAEPPVEEPGDAEIDLSEVAALPSPAPLDPEVEPEVRSAAEPEPEAGAEATFELDDEEVFESPTEVIAAEVPEPLEDEDFSFELDVDEVSAELAEADADLEEFPARKRPESLPPQSQPAETDLEERPAREQPEELPAQPPPAKSAAVPGRAASPRASEAVKLLIEADVLSRYGMDEMAITVLDRILQVDAEDTEAMARVVLLQLRSDRVGEALVIANQLADLVGQSAAPQHWDEVVEAMAECGFQFAGGRFVGTVAPKAPAPPKPPSLPEPAEELLVDLDEETPSLEEIVAETASLARSRPRRTPDSTEDLLAEVIDEIEREGGQSEPARLPAAPAMETPSTRAEADVEWIRELEQAELEDEARAPLEPGTGEFVDLATELEAELSEDGDFEDELLPIMGEQSLEDIVEGFRQGMAETLSDEDYDTHYNLGIAYREMGLLDEAIGEFQLAAKDPRYLVECCSLLASSFVDKSFFDLAVQWYVRGLDSSALDEESRCGLLYELGSLLADMGEPDAARERFLELYGVNSNFRDVVAKLEELPT
jgi:tetratricopeptide (TPR) repeat protein